MVKRFVSLSLYSRTMLGLSLALSVVIVGEVIAMGPVTEPVPATTTEKVPDADSSTKIQVLQIPPANTYREIAERPLFSDSRRPPPPAVQPGQSARAAQLASTWKLTGVVMAGDSSYVHVEGIRDRKTVRLQVGMPLGGWRLEEIAPDHVVFESAGERESLPLHDEKAGAAQSKRN